MDVQVGDVIQTKKPHPCGANRFDVLRVGMDFKIKCQGCGHEIMLPRAKIERNIKKVLRMGGAVAPCTRNLILCKGEAMQPFSELYEVERRYEELAYKMSTPDAAANADEYARMMRDYKELPPD